MEILDIYNDFKLILTTTYFVSRNARGRTELSLRFSNISNRLSAGTKRMSDEEQAWRISFEQLRDILFSEWYSAWRSDLKCRSACRQVLATLRNGQQRNYPRVSRPVIASWVTGPILWDYTNRQFRDGPWAPFIIFLSDIGGARCLTFLRTTSAQSHLAKRSLC